MTNDELNKYIKTYFTLFDFAGLDFDVEEIITNERKKKKLGTSEQNLNIKNAVKSEVKERIKKRYKENKDALFKDIMNEKISNPLYDEYTKARIIDLTFSVLDSMQKQDAKFYKDFIKNYAPVKKLLNNLFLDETDDNEVENELITKYKHLKPLIEVFKKDFYEKENSGVNLSMKEVRELIDRYRDGDMDARNELIEKNIGLCRKIAAQSSRRDNPTAGYEDLVQDGIEGLIKAIDKYDYTKGTRFSTYAIYWIRQSIYRSIENNSRLIRIPVFKYSWMMKVRRQLAELESKEGSQTREEILSKLELTEDEYEEFLGLIQTPTPLNKVINNGEDSDKELGEMIASDEDIEENVLVNIENEELLDLMKRALTPKETAILARRFGIGGLDVETLDDIGKTYGVTRERIRQLEMRALRKLKRYARIEENIEKRKDNCYIMRKY